MCDETREALKKAFKISKTIFGLGYRRYNDLLKATNSIKYPTSKDLESYLNDGMCLEDALITELKARYRNAATSAGFSEEEGIAMLEYSAMLEDMKE